ncbi:hypothetical protein GN958_ATG13551 [Phytophthora infestans]|uniref:Uncharacterized protein n=1 Tax=Phytophthora infestans TaxID=4787 RepID=A0A8S9UFY6_PHYIN|nr:hypothetical protein GN958_ATG13551 [Phytophthora infestans]
MPRTEDAEAFGVVRSLAKTMACVALSGRPQWRTCATTSVVKTFLRLCRSMLECLTGSHYDSYELNEYPLLSLFRYVRFSTYAVTTGLLLPHAKSILGDTIDLLLEYDFGHRYYVTIRRHADELFSWPRFRWSTSARTVSHQWRLCLYITTGFLPR